MNVKSLRGRLAPCLVAAAMGLAALPPARADNAATAITCDSALLKIGHVDTGMTLRIIGVFDAARREWIYADQTGAGRLSMRVPAGVYKVQLTGIERPGLNERGFPHTFSTTLPVHAPEGLAIVFSFGTTQEGRTVAAAQNSVPIDSLPAEALSADLVPAAPLHCPAPKVASATARPLVDENAPTHPLRASTAPDAARVRFVDRHPGDLLHLHDQDDCVASRVVAMPPGTGEASKQRQGVTDARLDMLDPPPPEAGGMTELSFEPDQVVNVAGGPDCISGVSFTTRASTQYEVNLVQLPDKRCLYAVFRLNLVEGQVKRTPENTSGLVCRMHSH